VADRVRITYYGTARVGGMLQHALANHDLDADFVGPPPMEQRGTDQDVAEWVTMYVVGKAVDHSVGAPVDTAVRAVVRKVVEEFRERFPNLTIRIED
jgi:hypothetical protein